MKVQIDRVRMAMNGNHYAYHGRVAMKEIPQHAVDANPTRIISGDWNNPMVDFVDATVSAEHVAMERGWPRYEDWQRHEADAHAKLLELAKSVYPELASADRWTTLWVEIPSMDEGHATRFVEYR
jgi:hypothetical protein